MRRAALLTLGILLAVPGAQGEPLVLDGEAHLDRVVPIGTQSSILEFDVGVRVDAERSLYVKVLASPGNPAYWNGTVDGAGWWTEFFVIEGSADRRAGASNGSTNVELGTFDPSHPLRMRLRVHAPSGAFLRAGELRTNFAVAAHSQVNDNSSGATLNPSILVQARILVEAGQQSTGAAFDSGWPAWVLPAAAGVGIAGAVTAMVVARKRLGGGPP